MQLVAESDSDIYVNCNDCGDQLRISKDTAFRTTKGYEVTPPSKCACGHTSRLVEVPIGTSTPGCLIVGGALLGFVLFLSGLGELFFPDVPKESSGLNTMMGLIISGLGAVCLVLAIRAGRR